MQTNFASIDLEALHTVVGGADKPAAPPAPTPTPTPAPRPTPTPAPQRGGNDTAWIRNTITCTRSGGPLLGALCGALTPSPAY